jgi:F0F1-type ATP synthase membrane subunit b/b'
MNNEDQLFTQLLYIFYSSAMVAMGKLKNPATDKIERNLEQAKQSIDILELIKSKSKNNLSDAQSRMLEGMLTDLRLNFVDESNKDIVTS